MSLLLALLAVEPDPPAETVGRRFKHYAKAYLKRGNEILVFNSDDEKERFLDAETQTKEAIEKAKTTRKIVVKRGPRPVETVELKGLQKQANSYEIEADIAKLVAQQDFERVLLIQARIREMQDEEDLEILLLTL
jgi:hypothetical protein